MSTVNFNEITTEVTDQVTIQNKRATDAISDADQFLTALKDKVLDTPVTIPKQTKVNVDFTVSAIGAIPPAKPLANINAIKSSIPTQPLDFEATVTDRAIQETPNENFTAPIIAFPNAPTFIEEVKPSKQETSLPNVATKPTPTIPSDLTVSTQNVPNIPSISLPNFGEIIPVVDITLPSATLAYVEPVYTSSLKTAIEADLLDKVQNGGTGLNATIEGDIYNRDVERLAQNLSDNIDDTLNRFSGRGFTMPPGVVAAQVQELQINHTNDRSQQSRDVAIQMANIADANTKFFLQTGVSWEDIQISHANNIANRSLDAEKSVIEFGIQLFNSEIAKFNAELAKYQAKDIEVQSNIKVQQLVLDQYKAELQGVDSVTNKDKTSIENYRAKLTAHDAQVRLYEAETSAIISSLNIERAKIEIFKADIDDYVARISAKKNEYDLYLAEVQGESAKVDLQRSNVETYAARVNAVKVSNDTVNQQIQSDIKVEELNLKSHLANVDIWKEKSQLAIQELIIEKDFFVEDNNVYREAVRMAIANAEINLQADVRAGQFDQAQSQLDLQKAIADMNALIDQSKFKIQGAEIVSRGYIAIASVAIGAIQTMYQLGTQGTDSLNTSA